MKIMKTLKYSMVLFALVAFVFSCTDDSLDPVQTKNVRKGTILALRGTQLDNLYNKGIPGAEVFPKIMTGAEKFTFDAEFLSENNNSLASVDVYVIKKVGTTRSRILMSNVPFSSFKTDGTYKGPWVTISYTMTEVLAKLGLPVASDPIYKGNTGNQLLTTYQPGIIFEADLNLVDGSKVTSDQLVAAGLYQSNQFYPAQILTWQMTDYCSYDVNQWAGAYNASEARTTVYGPYTVTLTVDSAVPNQFKITNFYDCGENDRYVKFSVSTNPGNQTVIFPSQTSANGKISGTGTYNQCLRSFSITVTYEYTAASCNGSAGTDVFRYDFTHQ